MTEVFILNNLNDEAGMALLDQTLYYCIEKKRYACELGVKKNKVAILQNIIRL